MQKKPSEKWKRLHWLSFQDPQSKWIKHLRYAQQPVSGWGWMWEVLMHKHLSISPSLSWVALCYFDITLTVKTEQELVIHTAMRDNNLSDKLTSALYSPASWVPTCTPTMESSKLTRRSAEGGQLTIQKPCCTPFRPWLSGSFVHIWCPGDSMEFALPFSLLLFIQCCGQQRLLHPQQALKGRDRETR